MPGQNEVEVKLKLVVGPEGARAMNQMTGEIVKASRAQDELNKKLDRARAIAAMTDRTGLGGGGTAVGGRGVGHTPGGVGAVGGRFGDAILARAGVGGIGRAGTLAAGAAGAAFVVQQGVSAHTRAENIRANPWMTQAQKEEAIARSRPFGVGKAFGESLDFYRAVTGREERFQAAGQRQQVGMIREEFAGRMGDVLFNEGFAGKAQNIRAQTFAGLSFQRPAGFDRGSVAGSKLFQEEQAMLPLIRQRQVAQQERLAAERTAGLAAKEEAKLAKELKDIDGRLVAFGKQREALNTAGAGRFGGSNRPGDLREKLADVYAEEAPLRARRDQTARLLEAAQRRTAGAKQTAAQAGFGEQQGIAAAQRQQANILTQREATARGQARQFGMMGIEGRLQGRMAYQLLQQIGVENAPAELIQQAAAYAPETVGKQAEKAGEKELGVAAGLTGSGEFRDTNLADISRRADAAREAATSTEEQAISGVEAGMADSLKGLADRLVAGLESAFMSALDGLRQKMEQDGYTRNHQ